MIWIVLLVILFVVMEMAGSYMTAPLVWATTMTNVEKRRAGAGVAFIVIGTVGIIAMMLQSSLPSVVVGDLEVVEILRLGPRAEGENAYLIRGDDRYYFDFLADGEVKTGAVNAEDVLEPVFGASEAKVEILEKEVTTTSRVFGMVTSQVIQTEAKYRFYLKDESMILDLLGSN